MPPTPPPPRRPGTPPVENEPLHDAERSERSGDLSGALAALRRHLDAHPGDKETRLRFARLLAQTGDLGAARRHLTALNNRDEAWPDQVARQANRALAELDETEGAISKAAERWERILADDIDDPQARARLRALRPPQQRAIAAAGEDATLLSPEGIETLRYRLIRELGRGATSAVYLAQDELLGIPIALKVLHPQLASPARSEARRRFFAEARLGAALRHPGVIAIYDLDEPTRTLSMEYLAGGTLRDRLRAHPVLPATEVWATARSFLTALAYVHGKGITHGDLKPSNLLLRAPGAVVLADFGIAQLTPPEGDAPGARATELPGGTPLYLAPEQFRGAAGSAATDLFGAGAILWELLHGTPLRAPADLVAGNFRSAVVNPARLAPLGPGAHRLAALITQLTAPDPTHRPPNAHAALTAIAD